MLAFVVVVANCDDLVGGIINKKGGSEGEGEKGKKGGLSENLPGLAAVKKISGRGGDGELPLVGSILKKKGTTTQASSESDEKGKDDE